MIDNKTLGWSASVAAVLLMVSGCANMDSPVNDFATMCENSSHIRIDDDECDRHTPGSSIMYISTDSSYQAPAVGGKIDQSRVIRSLPSGKTVQYGGIPKTGSVVKSSPGITRGGFGSSGVSGGS